MRFEVARTHYLLALRLHPGEGWSRPPAPGRRGPPRRPPRRDGDPSEQAYEGSRQHLERATRLLESLTEEFPERSQYRRLLALSYLQRPPGRRRREPGENRSHEGLAILEEFVREHPEVPSYRSDLIDAFSAFDPREVEDSDLDSVRERLEKALGHSEHLVRAHPNEARYTSAQAHLSYKLGSVLDRLARKGDKDLLREAVEHLRQSIRLQSALVDRFPHVGPLRVWLARFQNAGARLLFARKELAKAGHLLRETIASLEEFLASDAENGFVHGVLADAYERLAEVHEQAGRKDLAETAMVACQLHHAKMRSFRRLRR